MSKEQLFLGGPKQGVHCVPPLRVISFPDDPDWDELVWFAREVLEFDDPIPPPPLRRRFDYKLVRIGPGDFECYVPCGVPFDEVALFVNQALFRLAKRRARETSE